RGGLDQRPLRLQFHGRELLPVAANSCRGWPWESNCGRASEKSTAPVFAEDITHGPAHFADRGAVAKRVLDRIQQVAVPFGDATELLQTLVDGPLVASRLEPLEPFDLALLRLRIDAEDLDVVHLVRDVPVHADDGVL